MINKGGNHPSDLPLGPILNAVESSGMTLTEVARAAGYNEGLHELKRRLGMSSQLYVSGTDKWKKNKTVREATAVRILNAIGLDPVDIGI